MSADKYLGIVDADSILYRVCYQAKEDSLEVAKDTLLGYVFENIYKPLRCEKFVFCFSHGKTFRYDVAQTKPYKGNREKLEKPVHFDEIKQFAMETYNGIMIDNTEADDVVISIADLYKPDFVLAGIDKDGLQMEGLHFNYVKHEFKHMTTKDAQYNLAYQMLVGDNVDNIQGVPKIGAVKAEKLLKESKDPYFVTVKKIYDEKGMTEEQFNEHILLLRMKKDISHPYHNHFIDLKEISLPTSLDDFDLPVGVYDDPYL